MSKLVKMPFDLAAFQQGAQTVINVASTESTAQKEPLETTLLKLKMMHAGATEQQQAEVKDTVEQLRQAGAQLGLRVPTGAFGA